MSGGNYWILYNEGAAAYWDGRFANNSERSARKYLSREGAAIAKKESGLSPSWKPVQLRTAKKNPTFGKRKSAYKAFKKAKAKPAKKFGRRKVTVAAKKNPAEKLFVIRGVAHDGDSYYFMGDRFTSKKNCAALYRDPKAAEKMLGELERKMPKALKFLDVIQA